MLKSGPSISNAQIATIFQDLKQDASGIEKQAAIAQAFQLLKDNPEVDKKIDEYINFINSASQGIDDENFKLRFLAYASRNSAPEIVFSRLYSAFLAASRSEKIVGVNIVGAENHHIAMQDYNLHMNMLAFLGKQFPNVRLSLHAGELVLGMVPPEGLRFHINQAVTLAKANRIGHGVDIAHETNAPELLNLMAKKQIPVEVNITSNRDILGVKGADHPLSIYRSFKVPYVISTDDSGVSRNNLSGEYQLYMATFRPSYEELKNTVFNSIRYSFLSDEEKREELKKLDSKFRNFESAMSKYPKR
jgi:adenosine deaminase/adenosine deaminase CECR1